MDAGPGDLIESHRFDNRPITPWFVLAWALLFWILLFREDMDANPWTSFGYFALAVWFTLVTVWLFRRAPHRVAVHENGLNVTFGSGRVRFFPWSDVRGIDVDTYSMRQSAFVKTLSIDLARGPSLIINLREGRKLVEQIAEHVLPPMERKR